MMETRTTKRDLNIDIETYSSNSLDYGVYKYSESPDFEIQLFGYSWGDDPVEVIAFAEGEGAPDDVLEALSDPNTTKHAYNAQFERVCLGRMLGTTLDPAQWSCTMAQASMAGLPLGLGKVGDALDLKDAKKDSAGKALIRYFAIPSKTKGRKRNYPYHDWDRWDRYIDYNRQDVVSEHSIAIREDVPEISDYERDVYALDQRINDRGVLIDMPLVCSVIKYADKYLADLKDEAKNLTGLENPNSNAQFLGWLQDRCPGVTSANKDSVSDLLEQDSLDPLVRKVLQIKQELGKSSLAKYDMMANAAGDDGRIRGVLQYYGANRTGRWSGRLVQVQNLPRNNLENLDDVRGWVRDGDFETVEMLYDNVPDVLSQLIRTAFIAPPGMTLVVCDYSAIEARVIAWLAQETWRQEVFATTGKIYEASAAQMFHVPLEEVTKGSDYRKKGKVAELALGYQGGIGALTQMGGEAMGLSENEMGDIVKRWRQASPRIVQLWADVQTCAVNAVRQKCTQKLKDREVRFDYEMGNLVVTLPSGRRLYYKDVKVSGSRFVKITYMGTNQTSGKWCELDTYGGKLTENIVQAIARDCLARAMLGLERMNYQIVFHVHDEVVIEVPKSSADSAYHLIKEIMCIPIPWAPGLKLDADGFHSDYYMKD